MSITRVPAPVRQQLEDAVREDILAGGFSAGTRLVERDLCDRFEVSRSVVREALRQLESEGLLTHSPSGGMKIAVVGVQEAEHIYDVRKLLEPFAARQFIIHATGDSRAAAATAVREMEAAIEMNDTTTAIRKKNAFYQIMLSGCGNPVLEQTLRGLQNRIQLLRGASMSVPGRLQNTAREIRAIADALEARDADAAANACFEHLQMAVENTLNALNNVDTCDVSSER